MVLSLFLRLRGQRRACASSFIYPVLETPTTPKAAPAPRGGGAQAGADRWHIWDAPDPRARCACPQHPPGGQLGSAGLNSLGALPRSVAPGCPGMCPSTRPDTHTLPRHPHIASTPTHQLGCPEMPPLRRPRMLHRSAPGCPRSAPGCPRSTPGCPRSGTPRRTDPGMPPYRVQHPQRGCSGDPARRGGGGWRGGGTFEGALHASGRGGGPQEKASASAQPRAGL